MRDVAEIVVPWVFVTLGLFALLDWDESRLSTEKLEHAWPPATRTLALAYFGVLTLPIHFWRTRARRFVEPEVLRFTEERLGPRVARILGRSPSLIVEVFLYVLAFVPTLAVSFAAEWPVAEAVDELPESSLGAVMAASLAGFTAAMVWRARRQRARR